MEIVDLNDENIDTSILNELNLRLNQSTSPIIVKVFHPSCPHCNNMVDDWNMAMNRLKNDYDGPSQSINLHSGILDQNIITHPHLHSSTIDGLPTIRIISLDNPPIEYEGDRSADDIFKFCVQNLDIQPKTGEPRKAPKALKAPKGLNAAAIFKALNEPKTEKVLKALKDVKQSNLLPPLPANMSTNLNDSISKIIGNMKKLKKKKSKKAKPKKAKSKAKSKKAKPKKAKSKKAKPKKAKSKAKSKKALAKANKAKAKATKALAKANKAKAKATKTKAKANKAKAKAKAKL